MDNILGVDEEFRVDSIAESNQRIQRYQKMVFETKAVLDIVKVSKERIPLPYNKEKANMVIQSLLDRLECHYFAGEYNIEKVREIYNQEMFKLGYFDMYYRLLDILRFMQGHEEFYTDMKISKIEALYMFEDTYDKAVKWLKEHPHEYIEYKKVGLYKI